MGGSLTLKWDGPGGTHTPEELRLQMTEMVTGVLGSHHNIILSVQENPISFHVVIQMRWTDRVSITGEWTAPFLAEAVTGATANVVRAMVEHPELLLGSS